jgi:hypothetical protein
VAASTTIEVLAEPSRLRTLDALRGGEQPVHALVAQVAVIALSTEDRLPQYAAVGRDARIPPPT